MACLSHILKVGAVKTCSLVIARHSLTVTGHVTDVEHDVFLKQDVLLPHASLGVRQDES